jgi:hypothetical protein
MLIRLPPRTELAEANGLRAFIRVLREYARGEALGVSQQPDLAEILVEHGLVRVPIGRRRVVRAIYRAPTINLETASGETRRMARARWGAVLNALPHPLQIVVHGVPSTSLPVIERIKRHGKVHPPARELANWLQAHLQGAQLVERQRYVIVPADNAEKLADRCASLEASMRRIGLPLQRVEETADLRALVGTLLLGPRRRGSRMLPAVVDVAAADHLLIDGEYVRAFDLGKLPAVVVSDWAVPLLDGDLPMDVSIDIEPLDIRWAKLQLDARRNALESSPHTPGRAVALEQITGLRMAYERRRTLPMRVAVTMVLRSPYRGTLDRQTKRLQQRVHDLGAELGCFDGNSGKDGWRQLRSDANPYPHAATRSRPDRCANVPILLWNIGCGRWSPVRRCVCGPRHVYNRCTGTQEPAHVLVRHERSGKGI